MSAALTFAATYLLSLFVALLAALQLGDYFGAGGEFPLVITAVLAFSSVSMLAFIAAAATRRGPALHVTAISLALLAFVPLAWPALVQRIADRSTNPFTVGIENTYIATELVIPVLIAVAVQWALMRRHWLRIRGEDELSRWPWIATILAGLVILNPLGLDVLGQAIAYHASNWMRDFARVIVSGCIGVLIAIGLIEYYIRSRLLRRRLPPNSSAYGT